MIFLTLTERIPERVVHAKGGGAHGYFELTDSLSDITYARPYQTVGYQCPVSVRFSTVGGESGTPDTLRDPRGFSFKLKTDVGNMDWVYNNTPVFHQRPKQVLQVHPYSKERSFYTS